MSKLQKSANQPICWIPSKTVINRKDDFLSIEVHIPRVLESWRLSFFAYEWLDAQGRIKSGGALKARQQEQVRHIKNILQQTRELPRPVLGIGINDHIEIGAGRDVIMTLAGMGYTFLPVDIPRSCERDFKGYLA